MSAADFARAAARLKALVPDTKKESMQRVVIEGESLMKREVPVKSGALRRSITSKVERGGDRGVIGTNLKYARPVHDGTKPHTIRPKKARALFWPGARHPVRVVHHPGTKANAFVTRTRDRLRPIAERELGKVYGRALGRVG